jgi:hypothetical protein
MPEEPAPADGLATQLGLCDEVARRALVALVGASQALLGCCLGGVEK